MKINEVSIKGKMDKDAIANLYSDMVTSFQDGKLVVQKKNFVRYPQSCRTDRG
ncbi:MAG: hypothetical protein WA151_09175 [Desulfatirhabdiaceae bacterium]